jgi:ankyrin repeat protein
MTLSSVSVKDVFNAARSGNVQVIQQYLEGGSGNIDTVDAQGNSLLHWATYTKQYGVVRYLLQKGVYPGLTCLLKNTIIVLCVSFWSIWIFSFSHMPRQMPGTKTDLFVGVGIDINITNATEMQSALHWAVAAGSTKIVSLMVDNKVKLNHTDFRGLFGSLAFEDYDAHSRFA